jgi:hypothetical protein
MDPSASWGDGGGASVTTSESGLGAAIPWAGSATR